MVHSLRKEFIRPFISSTKPSLRRQKLLAFVYCFLALAGFSTNSYAQSRLIYFWSFNGYTSGTTYHLPTIPDVPADYNIGSTVAQMYWEPAMPVSASYASYSDISAAVTADFDTVNANPMPTYTVTAGNYFRARNPSDSMQLLFYIPSTNYQNITFRYGTETSSITSGDSAQVYSYSLDSGATWRTAGLSIPATVLNTATWDTFRATSVTITDPGASNNPRLVFRIQTLGRNHTTSGNNRFDNISVKGDTILPGGTLMYFWDFNTFAGTYMYPNFPYINPDYTVHPSSNAYIHFSFFPGTSAGYLSYFDAVAVAAGAADYDTVNDYWPQVSSSVIPSANGIRMRNPNDSTYLTFYIPSTNYKNINITYGSESSSYTSGDSIQVFSYSVDSGVTWRISGLSEALDSASLTFRRIHVSITDPAANNNPLLFFRLHLVGRNTGTSGNNRFDNVSVQGDSIISPLPTITTTTATYGPFCNTVANPFTVAYTSSGAVGDSFAVQITNANGTFPTNTTTNIIGAGISSPISATIPAGYATSTVYRVRVVSGYPGIYGSDNGSNITVAGVAGPISGPSSVCVGSMATLIESGSGTWTSSNTAVATIGTGTGVVSGVMQGTAVITFSVGPGCNASETITVNPLPAAIGGMPSACIATSTTLTDATASGTWSSSTPSVATIGSVSGSVTGVTAGTSIISYTLPTGCYQTQSLTVNPLPGAITGTMVVCQGSTTTLNDITTGGTWSSSNTGLATVGTSSGVVTGVASGVPAITYTSPLGCITTAPVLVNPKPTAIIGGPNGCVGTTTPLSDLTAFGAWSSSNPSVAAIGSSTGVVTGLSLGTSVISYTLSTGCLTSQTVSINSLPSGITGPAPFCAGTTITLNDVTPGGTWSSSNTAIATVNTTGLVTSIAGAGGNPTITYTLPSGCSAFTTLTVNPSPGPIAGANTVYCIGTSTTLSDAGAGTWTSSNTSIATVGSASGIVTSVAPGVSTITYTLPAGCYTTILETVNPAAAPIAGTTSICNGTTHNLTDLTAYGIWSSSNSAVAVIGSGNGIVTAESVGTAIITYGLSLACTTTATVTVNALPAAITGTTNVCEGLSITLADATPGGTFSASDAYLATVGASTGMVTGLVASVLDISYTSPAGCAAFTSFTVNPTPAAITGLANVCAGLTTNLGETTTGGTWISGNTSLATIGTTGMVTGVSAGTDEVTYLLPTGCIATIPVAVNPLPAAITGSGSVCMGLTTTLGDLTTGGTWSSSNDSLASINASTGLLTAVNSGVPMLTYTLPTGCIATTSITVNPRYPISGPTTFCAGLSTTLTNPVSGGTWSSSNTSVATIGSASGILNSIVPGNAVITYMSPAGCTVTQSVTVISLPAPITGTTSICQGLTSTLTDGSGIWISSNPAVANVNIGTGVVTGVSTGTATITYYLSLSSLGTTCYNSTEVTINPLPAAIAGVGPVCQSATITLTDLATGGTFTSSNSSVATIDPAAGVVTGIAPGNTSITYTLPTGCITTNSITVNPIMPITGITNVCQGFTTNLADAVSGGSWSSSDTTFATVNSTTGAVSGLSAGNTVISYTMPVTGCMATDTVTVNPLAAITGVTNVCAGLTTGLGNINAGGTWTSSNTSVSTIDPSLGVVTGVSAGVDTIAYMLPTGCTSYAVVTVNPLPSAITGTPDLCVGLSYSLADTTAGGTWSSSNTAVATIGSGSGLTSALATGTAAITYTLGTGCITTMPVLVNSTPEPITGPDAVCVGGTANFSDTGSGVWTSSNTSVASVGSGTGVATGISGGLALITYSLPTGCLSTAILTVNAVAAIMGTEHVCAGSAITLADTVASGSWSSSNTSVANVAAGSGVVTGVAAGTATIIYTLPTGCTTFSVFTVFATPAVFNVSGGGSYCAGGTGVTIYLSGSQTGVSYQLYDTTMTGAPMPGTSSSLSFAGQTKAGSYTVVATDTMDMCTAGMDDFATITITDTVMPSVTMSNGIGDTVCPGELVTYTATPVNGGPSPTYVWTLNGVNTSVYRDVYNINPHNGDVLTVTLVSNAICALPDSVSQTMMIMVDSAYEPSILITATAGINVSSTQADTLKAIVTGAGPSPVYQWYKDGSAISGATSYTYVSASFHKNDTVTCKVTGTGKCGIQSSAYIVMQGDASVAPVASASGHFTLFPNPNTGTFTIKGSLATMADQNVSLEVTDMLGQVVYKAQVTAVNGNINQEILLSNSLANGMYMLNLTAGTESEVFHFVIGQ